jgi:hypothetical protein
VLRRPANDPLIIRCAGGVFTLPTELLEWLRSRTTTGLIYIREDEDVLILSPTRITDARRRALHPSYRIASYRDVVKVAVINMDENVRIMPVEWRTRSSERRRRAAMSFD